MGLEYYALNNRTKEMIRPFNGWKAFEIIANTPGMCEVVMHKMLYDWNGDLVVMEWDWTLADLGHYKDITAQAIADYNDEFIDGFVWFAMHPPKHDFLIELNSWFSHFIFIDDPLVFIRFEEMFNRTYEFRKECWWMH